MTHSKITTDIKQYSELFKKELTPLYNILEVDSMLFIILEHYLKITRTDTLLNTNIKIEEKNYTLLKEVIDDLKKRKPLAYILGEWEFLGIRILVNQYTLIPRPETEELVFLIKEQMPYASSVLDIGTGSGCIALSLKKYLPNANIQGWDVSSNALSIAKKNAEINNLNVTFNQVNILKEAPLTKNIDVIVSNPPYILLKEKELMDDNVLNYEPHLALFIDNNTPLLFYIAIANFALNNLSPKGKLYFEINEKYSKEVTEMLKKKSFTNITTVKDINEKNRIVHASLN